MIAYIHAWLVESSDDGDVGQGITSLFKFLQIDERIEIVLLLAITASKGMLLFLKSFDIGSRKNFNPSVYIKTLGSCVQLEPLSLKLNVRVHLVVMLFRNSKINF